MTEQLKLISDTPTQYKLAVSSIKTLQETIDEVVQKQQQGIEVPADLFVTMASKQEQLFSVLVEFHRKDLSRLEEKLSEIGEEVSEANPTSGYVNKGKQLLSLQCIYRKHISHAQISLPLAMIA